MTTASTTFQQAVALHRSGRLTDASRLYDSIIRIDPRHSDALHLRGVAAHQQQRHDEAANYISRAIALRHDQAAYHSNLGAAYRAMGRSEQAIDSLRRAVQLTPDRAEYHYNLGNALRQASQLDAAATAFRQAIALRPEYADAHNNLGSTLRELGRKDEAGRHFERALCIDPNHVDAIQNLALVHFDAGRLDEAAAFCLTAIEKRPDFATVYNTLGLIRQSQQNHDAALGCFQTAIEQDSANIEAINNLANVLIELGRGVEAIDRLNAAIAGNPASIELRITLARVLKESGRLDDASSVLEAALAIRSNSAVAWNNLANCRKECGKIESAIDAYRRAVDLSPDFAEAHTNLATLLQNEGETAAALGHFAKAIQVGSSAPWRIRAATLLPPIVSSLDDMTRWRNRLQQQVSRLVNEGVSTDPALRLCETTFYLPYHGLNDRDIQQQIGRLHRSSFDAVCLNPARRRRAGKIRVGFLSRYFHNHTIGRLMRGAIARLDRTQFEVTVIAAARNDDDIARQIRSSADRYVEITDRIPAACRTLAELELDVLIFTDIGMDPITYTLAHSRFAPVQCVTWGHPVTTGLETIDYFLSSRLFETERASEHYTESLIRFESPGIHYFRPAAMSAALRSEFGLPEVRTLYGCPQSLFKIHPEFDRILGEILRRDRKGEVVLLSGSRPSWDRILMERLTRAIPDVVDRVRFIGRQSYEQFLRLNTVFDVLLDPIHFSGGNTSYEAFASGMPIVTWPSEFLRGRITSGLYRRMSILDCVAATHEDYVSIAIRVANDRDFRADMQQRILGAAPQLFEDRQAVAELEGFLRSAVSQHQAG